LGGISDRELTIGDKDGQQEVLGELALLGATENGKQRMLKMQQDFVKSLLQIFDVRIQNYNVAKLLRDNMDFRAMPLERTAAAHLLLLTGVSTRSTAFYLSIFHIFAW
jgi:hypothetical protein